MRPKSMLAQASIEFVVFVSILFTILLLTIYYNSSYYIQLNSAKIFNDAQAISDQVASEINMALKAGDGYIRSFYVPTKISNSLDYSLEIENYRVKISWSNLSTQSIILTKNVNGRVIPGHQNLIKNVEGNISVTQ
jgi:hypothetical protein